MDADLKARWTAALRSGEYEQGVQSLRTANDVYCCLGVLCDVADVEPDAEITADRLYTYAGFAGDLAPELAKRLGVEPHMVRHLIHMNDGNKNTFAEIADYIDANL